MLPNPYGGRVIIKKAILTKIRSKKRQKKYSSFTAIDLANFPFIDSIPLEMTGTICATETQKDVLDLIERHFHLHPLIPINNNGMFLSSDEIWNKSVKEVYEFCIYHSNPRLWHYYYLYFS